MTATKDLEPSIGISAIIILSRIQSADVAISIPGSLDSQIHCFADSGVVRVAVLGAEVSGCQRSHQIQSPSVENSSSRMSVACEIENHLLLVTPPFFGCLVRVERQLRQLLAQRECMGHMGDLRCLPLWMD